jgi:hypothetical protein
MVFGVPEPHSAVPGSYPGWYLEYLNRILHYLDGILDCILEYLDRILHYLDPILGGLGSTRIVFWATRFVAYKWNKT